MIKVATDFSGVGAFDQALKSMQINYTKLFACDYDEYARQSFILVNGTEADKILVFSKEHGKWCKKVKEIIFKDYSNSSSIEIEIDAALLKEANNFTKQFSFYYPFNVYDREIPEESCDVYVTSPPCQAFSMAGKRLGKEDLRGVLFFNSLEFIQKNKPRYFIFENVKGLLSHEKDKNNKKAIYGTTFQEWINFLGGKSVNGNSTFFPYEDSVPYHIYFQVMNAKEYGVPQNRERVFIIGIRDDIDNNFQFPKSFPLEKRLKDILELIVDEKYFLSDKLIEGFQKHKDRHNEKGNGFGFKPQTESDSNSNSLTTKYGTRQSDTYLKVGYINQDTQASQVFGEKGIAPNICAGTHGYANGYISTSNEIEIGTWRTHEDGKGFRATEDNNCPTIPARAREDGSGQPVVKIGAFRGRNPDDKKDRSKGTNLVQTLEINQNDTSNTITSVQKDNVVLISTNNSKGFDIAEAEEEDSINFSNPNSKTRRGRVGKKVAQTLDTQCNQAILTNYRIRRLTPRECFRLMDFPDHQFMDIIEKHNNDNPKQKISDSQLYKQAGNSIVRQMFIELLQKLNIK